MNTKGHESAYGSALEQNTPVFIRVAACPFVVELLVSG
jgi:hypothetical protein